MIKAQSHAEILSKHLTFIGKVIIDVGCGTGEMTSWFATQGSSIIGIDLPEMIGKIANTGKSTGEKYIVGTAEALPFGDNYADLVVYISSFHHVPENQMSRALEKCYDTLKPSGSAVLVEPVALEGSYYELVRIVEDEATIQAKAYEAIQRAVRLGFKWAIEDFYYIEKSFNDYINLIESNVEDVQRRNDIIETAKITTEGLCENACIDFDSFRYRSICRLNILEKP